MTAFDPGEFDGAAICRLATGMWPHAQGGNGRMKGRFRVPAACNIACGGHCFRGCDLQYVWSFQFSSPGASIAQMRPQFTLFPVGPIALGRFDPRRR
ncbi:hypothetical protein [Paracoccus sp. (in: a-proteobacteria)]|uniref:hypothetical protein n=1 Tax=Paracoccus sp. TaxID=267 RepID=UPI002AFFD434|nr:hypothetical protein [Paracoccus sp. (in: a-proteobacteria)]